MSRPPRRFERIAASMLGLALLTTSCGGKAEQKESSLDAPVRGGSVSYGMEAESNDGWCLPEAQLAISGITVARAIYDTLVVPNDEGGYDPYLLEAIEPNDDFTEWTLTVRDGVTFHNGEDLTPEVVRNNLDAYRGHVGSSEADPPAPHPTRSPLLFAFTFDNIDDVQVTGDREVTVTTKVPWVSFPAHLWSSGRIGIIAQEQLDDTETCDSKLIGTGPFQLARWEPNQALTAVRNPDYWQIAPDGEPYPYLEEIRFLPIVDGEQRVNALEAGELDIAHISQAAALETTDGLAADGVLDIYDTGERAELTHLMMNTSKPPFDDIRVRRAVALSLDREDFRDVVFQGHGEIASGPFAPGSIAHLDDAGYPDRDLEAAKQLVAEYEAEKGQIAVTLPATSDASAQALAIYLQQVLEDLGLDVALSTVLQSELISSAIAGDFQFRAWRNFPGGDPDELYVWMTTDSPANFGRIADPEVDRLFAAGRGEADPDERAAIYQDVNRQLTEGMWLVPIIWTPWRLAGQPTIHGYTPDAQPDTPAGHGWAPGLATGHPLHGLWVDS